MHFVAARRLQDVDAACSMYVKRGKAEHGVLAWYRTGVGSRRGLGKEVEAGRRGRTLAVW